MRGFIIKHARKIILVLYAFTEFMLRITISRSKGREKLEIKKTTQNKIINTESVLLELA